MHTCENSAARLLPDAFSPRIFPTVGRIRYACEAWHPTWSMRSACFGPAFLNRTCMNVHRYLTWLYILIPMLGFWDLSSCLSVFLRFPWVVPQQKARLRWLGRTVRERFRYIEVHVRESLVNDLSRLTYILCSCLFLTAGHDNLLASRSDPLGYLPSEDGESIQQELTLKEAFKRSVRSFGRRKIRNTVHTSISILTLIQRLNHHRIPHDHEANADVNTRGSWATINLEGLNLCYEHLFELYKLLHGAFLSVRFPHHLHFHPNYSLKSPNLYLRNGKWLDAFQKLWHPGWP